MKLILINKIIIKNKIYIYYHNKFFLSSLFLDFFFSLSKLTPNCLMSLQLALNLTLIFLKYFFSLSSSLIRIKLVLFLRTAFEFQVFDIVNSCEHYWPKGWIVPSFVRKDNRKSIKNKENKDIYSLFSSTLYP